MSNPIVSVVMITYGHELFIKQAIESVLSQITNFKIELIIANDASPDDSNQIINNLINSNLNSNCNIIYKNHKENIGVIPNFLDAILSSSGKYIALCEGDDYWTDPLKLQKQVDFLENNKDYVLTLHHRERLQESKFTSEKCNTDSIFLQCMVFKKFDFDVFFINTLKNIKYGDSFIYYKLLSLGKCKILDFNGAVYRIHENGIHSGLTRLNAIKSNLEALIKIKEYHKLLKNIKIVELIKIEITKSNIVLIQNYFKKNNFIKLFKLILQSLNDISFYNYLQLIKLKVKK